MEVNKKSNMPIMESKQNGVKKDYFHVPLDTHNGVHANKSFHYKRYSLLILLFEEILLANFKSSLSFVIIFKLERTVENLTD